MRSNHAGALDYQLNTLNLPAFMIELGTGQRAAPEEVARGIAGYTDWMRRPNPFLLEGPVAPFQD